jgi:dipeptidyl aminopeptidase/acylaminoacyl peptidase
MRADIDFTSAGVTCRGWLYRPDGGATPAPAIVMSHGFSATRHMGLPSFAERFCAAGFAVMVFDYRCLGDSDGAERGRIVPQEQHDDLRAAIDFIAAEPGIDPARIGLWGTSYSGGHALFVGALDARIKAIVAQVPALAVASSLIGFVGAEGFAAYLAAFAADLTRRNAGHPSAQVSIVAPEGQPCVFPSFEARDWFAASAPDADAKWVNHTTLESLARMAEYTPAAFMDLVAKPLLILAAEHDGIIPVAHVHEAFARAREPKELEIYPCGHFGLYPGRPFHEAAAERAAGWFGRWL